MTLTRLTRRWVLVVVAALATAALVYGGFWLPWQRYRQRAAEVAAATADKRFLVQQLEEQTLWETLDQTLAAELNQTQDALAAFHHDQRYIRELQQFSARTQLQLDEIKVRESAGRIDLSCRVSGAFADLNALFFYIETYPQPIRIRQVELQAERERLVARLELEFWRGI